ncbi:MAG: pilus assembly protein [Alphaproteobacteria bacterium]|nr:pilus assembly protein [Alphaproteobacteria bacterium]
MRLLRLMNPFSRRLARNKRGGVLIEFAFGAMILLTTMSGIIELSMVMFIQSLVEGGLREASRFGITGSIPEGMTREDRIRQIVGVHSLGLINMDTAQLTTKIYASFADIGKPEPFVDNNPANGTRDPGESYTDVNGNGQWDTDMGAAGMGGPVDIVLYTISADWPLLTPLVGPLLSSNGIIKINASVAVRNEPYVVGED